MISERSRNIFVGLTIIVALAVLMYGIILLGKFPSIGSLRPYQVTLYAPDANGITGGSHVEFNGVYAGQVTDVSLTSDAKGDLMAKIVLQIEHNVNIPASATAALMRPQAVGNPFVVIGAKNISGAQLAQDGTATLKAEPGDSGLIPKPVLDQLMTVARDLHTLLVYAPPEAVEAADPKDPNRLRENVSTAVVRLDRLAKSLQDLVGSPDTQKQVHDAIQNIADAAGELKPTLEEIKETVGSARGAFIAVSSAANSFGGASTQASGVLQSTQKEIDRVAQKLVETLDQIEKTTRALNEGGGTTAKLINDPRLYDSLIDLSRSLKGTVDDLDFLLKKWKDEGVNLHLGK